MGLIPLKRIDSFCRYRSIDYAINEQVIETVRSLDERHEIEPWLTAILNDTNSTPHGPAEIVDILTHKLTVHGEERLAAFILKGKSFSTVRPSHVSHQIFRLNRISGLGIAVFCATGNVLDDVKEEFLHTISGIGCDYTFLDASDLAKVFIGYGYICPRDGSRIAKGRCQCGYTPSVHPSNVLQEEALRCLSDTHAEGDRSGAVILPTGAGKTRIAASDIKRQDPDLALYVAHSHEILEDAETEFLRHFDAEQVKRFASRPSMNELRKVNLITIQTLYKNLHVFDGTAVTYMVVDEFHHAAAASYRRVIDHLRPSFLLGLTATPFRADQKDVLSICENRAIVSYDLRDGINFGILCPYHYFGCFDDIDYSKIRHNGIRYDVRDLERKLVVPERHRAIISKWQDKAEGKSTLAFCCSHEHAVRLAATFASAGIEAAPYLSTTNTAERAKIREEFRRGQIKILCAVDILNEGVDLPFVECLLFVRPTESKRVFYQQLGRGLRHHVGKQICTVIDFIGNFRNAYKLEEYHGLEPADDAAITGQDEIYREVRQHVEFPLSCKVEFEDRVIDIFGFQTLNPRYATRQNIDKILIYQYRRLERVLGYAPNKRDVDMSCLLGSNFYKDIFGSWERFEERIKSAG